MLPLPPSCSLLPPAPFSFLLQLPSSSHNCFRACFLLPRPSIWERLILTKLLGQMESSDLITWKSSFLPSFLLAPSPSFSLLPPSSCSLLLPPPSSSSHSCFRACSLLPSPLLKESLQTFVVPQILARSKSDSSHL